MNILFIDQGLPFPPSTGHKKHQFTILKTLKSEGHCISYLGFNFFRNEEVSKELLKYFKNIWFKSFVHERRTFSTKIRSLYNLIFRDLYSQHTLFQSSFFEKFLRENLSISKYDVIIVNFSANYKVVELLVKFNFIIIDENTNIVIVEHNNQSKLEFDQIKVLKINIFKKLLLYLDANSLKRYELQVRGIVSKFLYVSDVDKLAFQKYDKQSAAFPIVTEIESQPKNDYSLTNSILYSSDLNRDVNREGLRWYLDYCHSNLLTIFPNLQLRITGKVNSDILDQFKMYKNIFFTDYLSDEKLKDEFRRCDIFIAPLLTGSGIKVKMIEAMNFALPIVATSKSSEGIYVNDKMHYLLADTADKFVQEVATLLKDQSLRESIGKNARTVIEDIYSSDISIKTYLNFIIS